MRYVESGMSRLLQSNYNSPDRTIFPVYEEIRPIPGPAMGNNEARLLLFPSGGRNIGSCREFRKDGTHCVSTDRFFSGGKDMNRPDTSFMPVKPVFAP